MGETLARNEGTGSDGTLRIRAPPMNHGRHVKLLEIAGEVAEWLKAAVC
jgi:hypothetical protein